MNHLNIVAEGCFETLLNNRLLLKGTNYFYRMFKRLVGVSPVRYREVIGERPDMLA